MRESLESTAPVRPDIELDPRSARAFLSGLEVLRAGVVEGPSRTPLASAIH